MSRGETKINKTDLRPNDFVHLHNHTHYSLLDGLQKMPAMLDRVKELGMESVAVTDHGTLSGAIDFYKVAKSKNIRPIIGMEAYVAARTMADRDPIKDRARYHLILLAQNNQGYQNLMKLSTEAWLNGFYFKPRIDRALLKKYSQGLIVLSGCISSEVGEALSQDQDEKAIETIKWYKAIFGDRYYLELQDHAHKWGEQKKLNDKLLKLSRELDVPAVVTADAHYLKHEDQEAHEVLLCVQTNSFYSDDKRMSLTDTDLFLSNPKDVIERWKDHPELILNTKKIADSCYVDIELGKILIPKFPTPKGKSEKALLDELTYQGLAWRYGGKTYEQSQKLTIASAKKLLSNEILERASYELKVIEDMGYDGYFLIVWDFIKWGKDRGIVFGPGRGSAAGSIIAYALNITELDPLEYDLMFERFLNPDRISMPDIDIDIQDTRRSEVIEYCARKYGSERVANIATFGTMAARAAVRDVARVLQMPYAEADRLAKMVPPPVQGRHTSLRLHLEREPELKAAYESDDETKRVLDLAVRLEGTIRSHGVHAAGVVIAPDDLVKFTPLEMAQKGVVATQYSMNPIEDLGLLKMDFLGLSNLTIIKNALRIIKKVHNQDINIGKIPLDDKKTIELFQRGDTTGIFQFESAGMKRYLKRLKPTVFDDIIAMNALYRPGPMQFIEDFIARKNGEKQTEYFHPKMEDALKNTYGVLVYQEQVMQIARDLCGFTGGQSDTLRKGIGKKIPEVLAKMKIDFIEGAIKTSGADRARMEQLWKQLEDFAAYCFNRSHAACYSFIAYQTAYLKAHYPSAFMAALMTSAYGDTDRLSVEVSECQHMGIEVLPPSINKSFVEFGVDPEHIKQISFGLSSVKNVGAGAAEAIVEARGNKKFTSLTDLFSRLPSTAINRRIWESLIKAGALDEFGSRADLLYNLEAMLGLANRAEKLRSSSQSALFGAEANIESLSLTIKPSPETILPREQLNWERELIGIYLSQHPLDGYDVYLAENTVPLNALKPEMDNRRVNIGGVITTVRAITTKNGQKMGFVGLMDKFGESELVVFPSIWKDNEALFQTDTIIIGRGKINAKDRGGNVSEVKIILDEIEELSQQTVEAYQPTGKHKSIPKASKSGEELASRATNRLWIHLKQPDDHDKLRSIKQLLDKSPGKEEVVLVLGENSSKQALKLPQKVDINSELKASLVDLIGDAAVTVR